MGDDVRRVAARRVLQNVRRPELWSEPRISLDREGWRQLIAHREATGFYTDAGSYRDRCQATYHHQSLGKRSVNRPIQSHFERYLDAIGRDSALAYEERTVQD